MLARLLPIVSFLLMRAWRITSFQTRIGRRATPFVAATTQQRFLATPTEEVDPGVVEGTDLRILKYPHPSLRAKNVEIENVANNKEISKIAKEMFLMMYAAEGVGLAAPQVGINQRLMVFNASGDRAKWLEEVVLVNPTITTYSEAKVTDTEGCLSFPDMDGRVQRSKWIKVEATNLKGKTIRKKYTGWEARIFQHEYDHLEGTVYIDRVIDEDKEKIQGRLKELVAEHDPSLGEAAL